MADAFQWFIRFLHIMSGVMWVGGIYLWGMVIAPSVMKRVMPQARGPFMQAVLPRVSRYLGIAGALTILTGFFTMGLIWEFRNIVDVFQGTGAGFGYGAALGVGVVASIVMFALASAVIIPSANKLLEIMAKAPPPAAGAAPAAPPPHVMALQKRLMIGGMVNLLLGTLALAMMAWAVSERLA